jgi:hypothetical protein
MFNLRDPETTFDCRPSHAPRPPLLEDARQIMINAWADHAYACELVSMVENDQTRADFIEAEKAMLAKALEAQKYYSELWNESQKVADSTMTLEEEDI